jgi:DNA-binding MarR family transcriptional regulator
MTLEHLRVFVAVAECQHVTRAAEALNIAQSAVSASIVALEGRHGAKLFNRVGRRIELTEAGALFLAEARAVLARAESAELVLSELGDLKRGVLSVHASQTIAGYWLPRHLVASVVPILASRSGCRSKIQAKPRPWCAEAKRISALSKARSTIRLSSARRWRATNW